MIHPTETRQLRHQIALLALGIPLCGPLAAQVPRPSHLRASPADRVAELLPGLRGTAEQRSVARQRLRELGRPAVAPLIQAARSPRRTLMVRLEALRLVGVLRPTVREALPLLEMIRPRPSWTNEQIAIGRALFRAMRTVSDQPDQIQKLRGHLERLLEPFEDQTKLVAIPPPERQRRMRLSNKLPDVTGPSLPRSVADQGRWLQALLEVHDVRKPADLVELLDAKHPAVRTFAAERLGRLDPSALRSSADGVHLAAVLDQLTRASQPAKPSRRWRARYREALEAAAIALSKLAPTDPRAITGWVLRYRGGDRLQRVRAVQMLGNPTFEPTRVLPVLRQALKDFSIEVVREAVTALTVLGPAATAARADLEPLFFHPDPQVATRARAALRAIGR